MRDYSQEWNHNWAEFDPAIQKNYAVAAVSDAPIRGLPYSLSDLNYLTPDTPFFRLPFGLMTAGDSNYKSTTPDLFNTRDRGVMGYRAMLSDSAGYQNATLGMRNWEGDNTRSPVLTWQQDNSEYMLCNDLPLLATEKIVDINMAKYLGDKYLDQPVVNVIIDRLLDDVEPTDRLYDESGEFISLDQLCAMTGYQRPEAACLYITKVNNDYYEKHRTPGASRILNVIQGRNERESKIWFDNVARYWFEDLAFASLHKNNLEYTARRILEAREYMVRNGTERIHFLGKAEMPHLCAYSTIQEQVRLDLGKPNFVVSADASSPFKNAGFGGIYTGFRLGTASWDYHVTKVNDENFIGSTTPFLDHLEEVASSKGQLPMQLAGHSTRHPQDPRFFVKTEVGKALTIGDICVKARYSKKNGTTRTWDARSYDLITNHNIQVIIEGHVNALTHYHADDQSMVPYELLALKEAIREVFKAENTATALFKHRDTLNILNRL